MTKRWKRRPPGSTWGDWGDDDELGRINLLTPEKVLQGAREVQSGISFCLSLPLDYPGGTAFFSPDGRLWGHIDFGNIYASALGKAEDFFAGYNVPPSPTPQLVTP